MADLPETPITREEKYLSAISGQSSTDDLPEKPITRKEQYLDYIARKGTGGGGGTTNYEVLTNKPKINGVELSGNMIAEDLGIMGAHGNEVEGVFVLKTDSGLALIRKLQSNPDVYASFDLDDSDGYVNMAASRFTINTPNYSEHNGEYLFNIGVDSYSDMLSNVAIYEIFGTPARLPVVLYNTTYNNGVQSALSRYNRENVNWNSSNNGFDIVFESCTFNNTGVQMIDIETDEGNSVTFRNCTFNLTNPIFYLFGNPYKFENCVFNGTASFNNIYCGDPIQETDQRNCYAIFENCFFEGVYLNIRSMATISLKNCYLATLTLEPRAIGSDAYTDIHYFVSNCNINRLFIVEEDGDVFEDAVSREYMISGCKIGSFTNNYSGTDNGIMWNNVIGGEG